MFPARRVESSRGGCGIVVGLGNCRFGRVTFGRKSVGLRLCSCVSLDGLAAVSDTCSLLSD